MDLNEADTEEPRHNRPPRFGKGAGKGGRPDRAHKERKAPTPLNPARLDEMALAYVARFATSAGKLDTFLSRKLRERGWASETGEREEHSGEGKAAIATLIGRFVELGYVDDAGFAKMRSGSLLRRGFGARRIAQDLNAAGIGEEIRADCAPEEGAARRAALSLARKKGLGPFTRALGPDDSLDPALREKQVASLLRAGHGMTIVRLLVGFRDPQEAESWVAEAEEEDEPSG